MNKIIVIGCPGSGKSTFSKALHQKTALPLFHLDMLFWNADKTHVSRELFDQRLSNILHNDKWIIDGNYNRTLKTRLNACDTVFLLDLPVDTCLSGVISRMGKPRSDMPWTEQEINDEFKSFISEFPTQQLPYIYSLLNQYKNKNIIIFRSHDEINQFLREI